VFSEPLPADYVHAISLFRDDNNALETVCIEFVLKISNSKKFRNSIGIPEEDGIDYTL
ncbi:9513_t:CDS:2, partial [Gigaspora margarita]